MIQIENWQSINGKLVHDDQKAILVDDQQDLTNQKSLQESLKKDGKPIEKVRQELIKKSIKREIKTDPLKLRSWFSRRQDNQNAKKTEKLVSDKPTHQYKLIKNELTFLVKVFWKAF